MALNDTGMTVGTTVREERTSDRGLAALEAALGPLLPQHREGHGGYPYQSSDKTWTVYDWMSPDQLAAAILGERVVFIDGDAWPWPGDTRLPWQVWNEVPHPDGMTVYDPDGFRNGRPTIVTWDEFERARMECTMVHGRAGHEVGAGTRWRHVLDALKGETPVRMIPEEDEHA